MEILKKLKVDYIFLPNTIDIYKQKRKIKIKLKMSQKILCARFRPKGHFEGVLDIVDRLVKMINPKYMFMGEKDYQQYILVKNFIQKKYKTKILLCKTIRNNNDVALSSRNYLLNKKEYAKSKFYRQKFDEIEVPS